LGGAESGLGRRQCRTDSIETGMVWTFLSQIEYNVSLKINKFLFATDEYFELSGDVVLLRIMRLRWSNRVPGVPGQVLFYGS
jgi:hypothetical protein